MPSPSAWISTQIDNWIRDQIIASGGDCSVVKDEPQKTLKLKDVIERTRLSKSSIYRQIAAGKFPRPFHLIN
jgi:predicted DNA-binding transcriptional regulator AlpA